MFPVPASGSDCRTVPLELKLLGVLLHLRTGTSFYQVAQTSHCFREDAIRCFALDWSAEFVDRMSGEWLSMPDGGPKLQAIMQVYEKFGFPGLCWVCGCGAHLLGHVPGHATPSS